MDNVPTELVISIIQPQVLSSCTIMLLVSAEPAKLSSLFSPHTLQFSQAVTTFQNKATGQLSLITCTMNWLGTGARIFTTIQETQDAIILAAFVSSFAMNSIILVQFLLYPVTVAKVKKQI